MKFCPQCGKAVDENMQFCTQCGCTLTHPGPAPSVPEDTATPYYKKAVKPAGTRQTIIVIAAIAGIIIVMAVAALFILPQVSGPAPAQPEVTGIPAVPATVASPVTFVIPRENGPQVIPATGVWIHVSYLGSWNATYGMPGAMQTQEDSGERFYEIPRAGGTINLVAGKLDSSAHHALAAEIVKDGVTLANGSTRDAYGIVTLSAVAGPVPVPSASTDLISLTNAAVTTSSAGRTPAPVTSAPVCPSDRIACEGNCTDTSTDNANCGFCRNSCPSGKTCILGNCLNTCLAEQTSCPDGCFNLMTDPRHCGSCGNSCPRGLICNTGRCNSPETPMPVPQ